MKLITKTIFYYVLISLPLLIGTSIVAYNQITDTVEENTREILWNDKTKAENIIKNSDLPDNLILSFDSLSTIRLDTTNNKGYKFLDLFKMSPSEDEAVHYRALISYYKKGNTNYIISIMRPVMEEDDLIENLISLLLLIIAVLILTFFLVNLSVSQMLWKPFNRTLKSLGDFELTSFSKFEPGNTTTREFKKLNDALIVMTDKMRRDYAIQKEFTENASHEIQTPLAVIKAKVEQLMQLPQLKQEEMAMLNTIENSLNKLSSLNKSLLLLAKIENHQYKEIQNINIKGGIQKVLNVWEDFINEKNISVNIVADEEAIIKMHPDLFDLLVTNLVQNAVRYNIRNGQIAITITNDCFSMANTGKPLDLQKEEVFNRFKKGNSSVESTGLGLAIVKSISECYKYEITYAYSNNMHVFKLKF